MVKLLPCEMQGKTVYIRPYSCILHKFCGMNETKNNNIIAISYSRVR
jgi:hypothetical protein